MSESDGQVKVGENDLVCVFSVQVESRNFERGEVLGEKTDRGLKPKARGVTRGNLEALLRRRRIQVGPLAEPVKPVVVENDPPGVTALPEDFPGREVLVGNGIVSVEAVKAQSREDLLEVKGIGESTADAIAAALAG